MVDMSFVSRAVARVLGGSFTGGLSTGTAMYTGERRPVTRVGLLLVKRGVSTNVELGFVKGLNLSTALGF